MRDPRNYGVIDLATVIQKSSNVGATRVALALEPEAIPLVVLHEDDDLIVIDKLDLTVNAGNLAVDMVVKTLARTEPRA